jgi:tetratricopeptide (TPR) repeat protein
VGTISRAQKAIALRAVTATRTTLGALVLALALGPLAASAQTPLRIRNAIARNHFELGNNYFQISRYEDAAREFQAAYDITHQNELLFNIGRALEAAGNVQGALDAYQRFLDAGAPGFDRDTLRARMETLRQRLPQPPRRTYHHSTLNTAGPFVLLGGGVVLGGLALWQGLAANDHVSLVTRANNGEVAWNTEVATAYRSASGEITAAWVLGAAGGALAVGGTLWLALRGSGERREVVEAFVVPTPGGAAFGIGGRL